MVKNIQEWEILIFKKYDVMSSIPPPNDTLPLFTNRMQNIIGRGKIFAITIMQKYEAQLKGLAEIEQRSLQEQYMVKLSKDELIYLIIYFNKTNNSIKLRSTGNKSFLISSLSTYYSLDQIKEILHNNNVDKENVKQKIISLKQSFT